MLLCAARQCGRVWVCGADAPTSWCGFWSGDKSLRLEVGFEIVDLGFQFRSRKLPILGSTLCTDAETMPMDCCPDDAVVL